MEFTVTHDISDEEMRSLCHALKIRYGTDFTNYEPKSLKRRLVRAFKKFELNTVMDLWQAILKDVNFIYSFVDEITVGLTSMFRDPELWVYLRKQLPVYLKDQSNVNIWHAGCSTGEEVATTSIMLEQAGLLQKCRGHATDLNKSSVAFSSAARYSELNWPEYQKNYLAYRPNSLLSDHFDRMEDSYALKAKYRSYCRFERHNLLTDTFKNETYDIIFCRNVMIYFEVDVKKELLTKFYKALKPDGLLVVGFLDNMLPLINSSDFIIHDTEAKIFRKV